MAEELKVVYACKSSAGFLFRVGETRHRFQEHQLILTNEDEIIELDEALEKYPNLAFKVKKVKLAEAEALVANHKATHGGAISGPFSSSAMSALEPNKLGERDKSLDLMSTEQKAGLVEAMAKDSDLILTEKVARSEERRGGK